MHILIYDHKPALLAKLSYVFIQAGHKTTTRHPGYISVGQVIGLQPDVLVIGYTLDAPKDTLDILRQLREHPDLKDLPVVVTTPLEQNMTPSVDEGNTHHVAFAQEQFDPGPLLAKVREITGQDSD